MGQGDVEEGEGWEAEKEVLTWSTSASANVEGSCMCISVRTYLVVDELQEIFISLYCFMNIIIQNEELLPAHTQWNQMK